MIDRGLASEEAVFLPGMAGDIFIHYFPAAPSRDRANTDVIIVPPFAEEMNCSRRMLVTLARQLSRVGVGAVLVDLYGTGDSEGEFRDARWETWQNDIINAADWLVGKGTDNVILLGLRLGSLLATSVVPQLDDLVTKLIFWQPVTNGHTMLTQFLRLEVAGGLDGETGRVSTKQLRQRLAEGKIIEVAGYELHSELAKTLEGVRLQHLLSERLPPITWFDVAANPTVSMTRLTKDLLQQSQGAGARISHETIIAQPFWLIQEPVIVDTLLANTLDACKVA